MSNQTSRIQNVDVGTPPSSLNEWEIINVRYHDFENLTTNRGEAVLSPEFACFGHQWCLKLYPGGDLNSDDGMVGIFLAGNLVTCPTRVSKSSMDSASKMKAIK